MYFRLHTSFKGKFFTKVVRASSEEAAKKKIPSFMECLSVEFVGYRKPAKGV